MKRPNILFLMADEHRADIAGFAGNPVARTPHLDRIASQSAVFTNAYCATPVCSPGRQCMMLGQWPWTCGATKFEHDIPAGSYTFAAHLARHGYYTACAGKLHHRRSDQMQGWIERINPDAKVTAPFRAPVLDAFKAPPHPESGTGKWSNEKEVKRAGIGISPVEQNDRLTLAGAKLFIENYFCDPWYDRPQSTKPLLLKVSLGVPHYPFFCREALFKYYLNRVPIFRDERAAHPILGRTQYGPDVNVTDREIRRATAAYYGLVETMDTMFGEVLDALADAGQNLDDWLILYTSDHGDMLGQHGIWEKATFFEGSARVPLLIKTPGSKRSHTIHENVNLIDLYATLCDLTECPTPEGLDSRSLAPALRGQLDDAPRTTFCQYNGNRLLIKTGALKYLYFSELPEPEAREVLFDLAQNPGETQNRIGDAPYAEAIQKFRAQRKIAGYK